MTKCKKGSIKDRVAEDIYKGLIDRKAEDKKALCISCITVMVIAYIIALNPDKSLIELVQKSDQLLKDTLEGKSDAVAKGITDVHDSEYAPTYYSNEQSL